MPQPLTREQPLGAETDATELRKFADIGRRWWDTAGPMAPLHKLNPVRVAFVRDLACRRFGRHPDRVRPLAGITALDVGCGGGLLAEPLARLGAVVTGIDPVEESIVAARWHSAAAGLAITYDAVTLAAPVADGRRFDLVVASEVIEHVPDVQAFLSDLAKVATPDGLLVLSTLNRTARSFVEAIVGAEYLLGWLPRGTHDWRRFLTPAELARELRAAGLRPIDMRGIAYDPGRDRFVSARAPGTNYIMAAVLAQA